MSEVPLPSQIATAPAAVLPGLPADAPAEVDAGGMGAFALLLEGQLAGAGLPVPGVHSAAETAPAEPKADPAAGTAGEVDLSLLLMTLPATPATPAPSTADAPPADAAAASRASLPAPAAPAAPLAPVLPEAAAAGAPARDAAQPRAVPLALQPEAAKSADAPAAKPERRPALAEPTSGERQTAVPAAAVLAAANPRPAELAAERLPADVPAAAAEQPAGPAHGHANGIAPASPPGHAPARIEAAVGSHRFAEELANRLVVIARGDEHRAELTLNPPQMGRLEVTLTVSGGEASAVFVSANPLVRDSLEQALPRLREVLAEAGLSLGEASVNAESPGRDEARNEGGQPGERRGRSGAIPVPGPGLSAGRRIGLIDTFV